MENKVPPVPPRRPFIAKTNSENTSQNNTITKNTNNLNINNTASNSSVNIENQGQSEVKKKFELNSQTKAFILFFAAFFCIAGAVACFVFLFI